MRTETLEVDKRFGEEYAGRYVFQEISWAKRSRIIQKYTKYSQMTGQVVKSDYVAIQAETIWASLKEQPPHKPITLEKLLSEEDGIPIGLGELFSQIVNKLNNVGLDETRFLSEQSEAKNLMQKSQSSDSAKNLGGHRGSLKGSQPRRFKSSS
ncbi:hypothetical protein DRO69_10360 [Candidatus Bathyarchaeota archaeon]|nr:MAG: hypothetical protein DRO69_10360 [Candidatus Bathyarchaeota archaeon]